MNEIEPCDPNEGRRIDGSCNNLEHPTRGASNTPVFNVLPTIFINGMFGNVTYTYNQSITEPNLYTEYCLKIIIAVINIEA